MRKQTPAVKDTLTRSVRWARVPMTPELRKLAAPDERPFRACRDIGNGHIDSCVFFVRGKREGKRLSFPLAEIGRQAHVVFGLSDTADAEAGRKSRAGGETSGRRRTEACEKNYSRICNYVLVLHTQHPQWTYPVIRTRTHNDLEAPGESMCASAKTIDRATVDIPDRAKWGKEG